jgi:hypothetical protein
MGPWQNFFHVTGSTYGTWLRGDPRGWRARHHRKHVDGDYRNPPPKGKYDKLNEQSKRLMKRERVVLTRQQRQIACQLMVEALLHHKVEVIDLCVGAKHWDGLARFCPVNQVRTWKRDPRNLMGIAKKHSARVMSDRNIVPRGGVWAARCKVIPVKSRWHLDRLGSYIPDHAKKGAAVYSLMGAQLSRRSPGI